MPIKKIKKRNISDEVLDEFKRLISSGEWKAGEKIPSENDLAEKMGVSRVTIRSALEKLKSVGLVESRQGGGTFVCHMDGSQCVTALFPVMMLERHNQDYVLEFRELLECEQAYLAAKRAEEEDIQALRENLEKMYQAVDSHADYTELDLEFHMLLARACKNPLMIQTSEILRDVVLGNIRSGETRRDTKKSAEYHRRILEAIEQHDGELARSIMKEHMEVAEQDLDRS